MYATCPYCHHTIKLLYSKTDGSFTIRKHYVTIPVTNNLGFMPQKPEKEVCGGSYLKVTSEKEAQP